VRDDVTTHAEQPLDDRASSLATAVNRDIVLIGGSAGGLEALERLMPTLPGDLPAAVFVVIHLPADSKSALTLILGRKTTLPVDVARDGDAIERGRVYVAPPDHHVLIEDGHVRLSKGPRENGNRPAIDPLFRTAARVYGPRVLAVVLSGNLGDGSIGLRAVASHGGLTVVQDPEDALYPSMPTNAIEGDQPDHVVRASEIGALIARYAVEAAPLPLESAEERSERPAAMSCPECGGPLFEFREGGAQGYACRVGHSFSPQGLFAEQADALESALWTAIRVLEERCDLATGLAERLEARDANAGAARFRANAEDARRQADAIRAVVVDFDHVAGNGPQAAEVASAARGSLAV
jgi:two-component system chemotaxis response regulator CheB